MTDNRDSPIDKWLIYPNDSFQAEGLRQVEHQALRALKEIRQTIPGICPLVSRTRDIIQIDDDEKGISFVVSLEALEIRHLFTEWTCGSHGPATSSKLWRRIKWRNLDDDALAKIIKQSVEGYRRRFRTCHHCKVSFGPGRYLKSGGKFICHGCASAHEGILF